MSTPVLAHDEDDAVTEARALALAIAESDADPRIVAHDDARVWLLRLASGDFDAAPPEPH